MHPDSTDTLDLAPAGPTSASTSGANSIGRAGTGPIGPHAGGTDVARSNFVGTGAVSTDLSSISGNGTPAGSSDTVGSVPAGTGAVGEDISRINTGAGSRGAPSTGATSANASRLDGSGTRRAAIVGLSGPFLTDGERTLLRTLPPLGIILFKRNIEHPAQLATLVAAIRDTVPGALLCVDQEGGRVARLRPPHWLAHPPAATIGALHARNPAAGLRAAFLCGALIGAECASARFDLVCAPVLDLAVPGADAVIGDRAFSSDPDAVSVLGSAFADGLLTAGIQPVGKHAPGHGRSLVDSHLALPELDTLDEADLAPFRANAAMSWMMTAHIRFRAIDPLLPATLSRAVLQGVLRERLGLTGVLVSDDLSMHAVTGEPGALAAAAIAAGCDVALHCSGVETETRSVLEAVGQPDEAARLRLAAAARLAAERRASLDVPSMLAERAALLG